MEPRQEVKVALARLDMTQAELAERLGIKPQTLSRVLTHSPLLNERSAWPAIIDALGLEVVLRAKS